MVAVVVEEVMAVVLVMVMVIVVRERFGAHRGKGHDLQESHADHSQR